MKINSVKPVHLELLGSTTIDFIFCSSGYESRASYFYSTFKKLENNISEKYCFLFDDRKVLSRDDNDHFFNSSGFKPIEITENSIAFFIKIYRGIFSAVCLKDLNIIVDYTCMTSIIYASILKYFNEYDDKFENVYLHFAYTQAKFTAPIKSKPLSFNHPIPFSNEIQTTDKKIALLIGLGYEVDKALGLFEYFQNDRNDIYLFITGKDSSEEFYSEVTSNNQKIISIAPLDNVIYYDLENISPLLSSLDAIVNYLVTTDYRVVIAPIGPKVFTLCSLLTNLLHPSITTYRLSDGVKGIPVQKEADGDKGFIITNLHFIERTCAKQI